MSARLHERESPGVPGQGMAVHIPNAITDDPPAISDLVDELLAAAKREGIAAKQIYEAVESVSTSSLRPCTPRRGLSGPEPRVRGTFGTKNARWRR